MQQLAPDQIPFQKTDFTGLAMRIHRPRQFVVPVEPPGAGFQPLESPIEVVHQLYQLVDKEVVVGLRGEGTLPEFHQIDLEIPLRWWLMKVVRKAQVRTHPTTQLLLRHLRDELGS